MKRSIIFALLLALLMGFVAMAEEGTLNYTSDFSSDLDGWFPRSSGTAQAEIIDGALRISGRTASWNSPGRYFKLVPGSEYHISCEVMQTDVDSAEFMISVAHSKNGVETYENLARGNAAKDKWTKLNCTFTFGDFDQYMLYVETVGNATLDFSIRNFKVVGESVTYDTSIPSLKEAYKPYFDFGCAVTQIEAL